MELAPDGLISAFVSKPSKLSILLWVAVVLHTFVTTDRLRLLVLPCFTMLCRRQLTAACKLCRRGGILRTAPKTRKQQLVGCWHDRSSNCELMLQQLTQKAGSYICCAWSLQCPKLHESTSAGLHDHSRPWIGIRYMYKGASADCATSPVHCRWPCIPLSLLLCYHTCVVYMHVFVPQ